MGASAHLLIAYHYGDNNIEDDVYANFTNIPSILERSGTGDPAKVDPSRRALRPDITNATTRRVFEIKPWNDEGL